MIFPLSTGRRFRYGRPMLQIIFSPVSARELADMPRKLQLELLDGFEVLPQDFEKADEKFGQLTRGGHKIYRYRVKDYRIYFEKRDNIVYVRCILSKNTLKDFLFRTKLPVSEDQALQENPRFWQLLESGEKR
jgi:mRNA-degrading endonuclease RelE of RelBE toxin-antitoxin system